MLTPTEQVLDLSPHERLASVLAIWPTRWSAHTIAAAKALPEEDIEALSPSTWFGLLDVIESRLLDIAKSIADTT